MSSILPSDVQAWVRRLEVAGEDRKPLAPTTIGVLHSIVAGVFKAAVRDRRTVANPCEGTRLPKVHKPKVVPPTTEQVDELRDTSQLVGVDGLGPRFGPPKTAASVRTIPLPQVVVDSLAAHLAAYSAVDGLVFTLDGLPVTRQRLGHLWRPAASTAGLPGRSGRHALRHYYPSLLIRHGESVKTVQSRLGHASAVETLDTYSHLWPDSDDRTREARRRRTWRNTP